jgi:hypothetical protein
MMWRWFLARFLGQGRFCPNHPKPRARSPAKPGERAVNASLPSGFKFARARSNSEPDMEWTGPKLSVWVVVGDSADKSSYAITLDHDLRAKWWEFWKHETGPR